MGNQLVCVTCNKHSNSASQLASNRKTPNRKKNKAANWSLKRDHVQVRPRRDSSCSQLRSKVRQPAVLTATTRSTTGDYCSTTGDDIRWSGSGHQEDSKTDGSQIANLPTCSNKQIKRQRTTLRLINNRDPAESLAFNSIQKIDSINKLFEMGKVMGQGTYGVVKKATSRRTGE